MILGYTSRNQDLFNVVRDKLDFAAPLDSPSPSQQFYDGI